jgi:hypothetical protein
MISTSGSSTSQTACDRQPFSPEARQQRRSLEFTGREDIGVDADRQLHHPASGYVGAVLRAADHGGSALFLSTETMVGVGPLFTDDARRRIQLSRLLRRENVDALEADVVSQVYDEYINVERRVISSSTSRDARREGSSLNQGIGSTSGYDSVL